MKNIYLDYASITPIDPAVQREMNKWRREPLNPSSIHSLGVKAKKALDDSRKGAAEFLNAHPDEIIFTSGGTEANTLALEGVLKAAEQNGLCARKGIVKPHLIISAIEHSSIIETANMLEKHGVEVTRLSVDKNGLVSLEQLRKAIKPETFLVSIMTANNEIGTIEPIKEIAKVIRDYRKVTSSKLQVTSKENQPVIPAKAGIQKHELCKQIKRGQFQTQSEVDAAQRFGIVLHQVNQTRLATLDSRVRGNDKQNPYPLLHTDACQAVLYEELNVEKLGIDLLTLDASKAYGPRGIGALYVKRGTPIEPIIYGGGQERGLRSGTENIPGVVGFAKALELVKKTMLAKDDKKVVNFSCMEKERQRVLELRDFFEREVKKIRPDAIINAADMGAVSAASLDKLDKRTNLEYKKTLRVPHISNITFPNTDAEMLLLRLDAKGIAVSTKSACLKDEDESYVLRAIGADSKFSLRFSFGRWTKKSELKKTLHFLKLFLS
jgi:cysteine desulfurase